MDLQLNIALSTLQMNPADRTDASVESVANWLREKSKLFKQLDYSILTDVARNCSLQMFPLNHVLIRQGDRGDCFYIILRGQVGVYICTDLEPGKMAGIITDEVKANDNNKEEKKRDRTLFGKHIVNLSVGASFGELALINDDCIRNASVITDIDCHFICIDRALYNRSLKTFQARDFEDRNNFIETHPLFSNWPPRIKRQVAMSLERVSYDFESLICKQGKQITTVYFIVRGTVRLVYNSATLNSIVGSQIPRPSIQYDSGGNSIIDGFKANLSINGQTATTSSHHLVEVCSLANGEVIGDLEMLYPLDYYLFTAIAAAPTDVLTLSQKNMSRFLESKTIAKTMIEPLTHAYRRLADRVEKSVRCSTLKAIFNNVRQIIERAEAKRILEEQNKLKRAQYQKIISGNNNSNNNKPSTPGAAMRQVRTSSLGSGSFKPSVTVTPATNGFKRFIRQDVDDNRLSTPRRDEAIRRQILEEQKQSMPLFKNVHLSSLIKKVQEL